MRETQSEGAYVTTDELSKILRLSKSTIHRLRAAGKIPCFQPGGSGHRILYSISEVLDAFRTDTTSVPTGPDKATCQDRDQTHLTGRKPNWMTEHDY